MTSDDQEASPHVQPDHNAFLKFAQATMPFGKYAGRRLVDLPEQYVVWLSRKGFPKGELGELLSMVYEIKVNGFECLFEPLLNRFVFLCLFHIYVTENLAPLPTQETFAKR